MNNRIRTQAVLFGALGGLLLASLVFFGTGHPRLGTIWVGLILLDLLGLAISVIKK